MKFHSKAPRGLVALGSAAVIAVYSAGFIRTRAAAAKFASVPALRRPAPPAPVTESTSTPIPAAPIAPAPPPVVTAPVTPKIPTREAKPTVPAAPKPAPAPIAVDSATKPDPAPLATTSTVTTATVTAATAPATSTAPPTPTPTSTTDAAAPAKPADDAQPKGKYKDGSYSAWGTSRHGDLQVTVVIAEGRIASAMISQCGTRYPCSYIAHLQAQVAIRQSADVDYVSGATESANAFYNAVLDCLTRAHR